MYLSNLLIDTGENADRPRPGRSWLRNLYHVHQRLCMAFPSASRKENDPDFLAPYQPEDFDGNHVHVKRQHDTGFLFRIDPLPGGRAIILVQSAMEPDWDYAFHNAGHFLSASTQVKLFNPAFKKDQCLRFRLLANPTRRLSKNSRDEKGELVKPESIGKRVPVPFDKLYPWLAEWPERQKGTESDGFTLLSDKDLTTMQTGYVYFHKPRHDKEGNRVKDKGRRLFSVRYDGTLKVTDPEKFKKIIAGGIGSGKAFGFGLLSVAPIHD